MVISYGDFPTAVSFCIYNHVAYRRAMMRLDGYVFFFFLCLYVSRICRWGLLFTWEGDKQELLFDIVLQLILTFYEERFSAEDSIFHDFIA